MMFGYLTLATALIISLSAAVYSILGLTAIFAAAFWPIVIMGGSLEFGKIVTTLWLHKYWDRAELQYKVYLCSAVAILMLLTSMGVFGFLSKAHTDQALISGDVISKIAIYDEKIKIEKDNIDANRKALKQMDEAVDQVMARSTTEGGADKAVAIRRAQQKERSRILAEIGVSQKNITALNEQRAPIAADVRKVEAEVGPIKYIAALVYGDNPDANVLEKAVRWVIILIVVVFDPLALTLLLAATKTFEWERGINILAPKRKDEPEYEPDDGPLTTDQVDQIREMVKDELPTGEVIVKDSLFQEPIVQEPIVQEPITPKPSLVDTIRGAWNTLSNKLNTDNIHEKIAERAWKIENPDKTLKKQRQLLKEGKIDQLPWNRSEFRARINAVEVDTGFGKEFPATPNRGDVFLKTDRLPTVLYKYNGSSWMQVDKDVSDSYAYNTAYVDYLIEKIASGEYDPELLSESERINIEQRLNQNT